MNPRGEGHPPTPDFANRSDLPPWLTALEGWYTRYGPVDELTAQRDGRYIIMSGADAVELRFAADALPALPDGMSRTFVLETVGWIREGDPNAPDSLVAAPLGPDEVGESSDDGWQATYNTRWSPRDPWRRR
jgi:hypothetical protein